MSGFGLCEEGELLRVQFGRGRREADEGAVEAEVGAGRRPGGWPGVGDAAGVEEDGGGRAAVAVGVVGDGGVEGWGEVVAVDGVGVEVV